jgi:hypothetical protein
MILVNTTVVNACVVRFAGARVAPARARLDEGIPVSDRYDLSERLPYLINRVGAALVASPRPA